MDFRLTWKINKNGFNPIANYLINCGINEDEVLFYLNGPLPEHEDNPFLLDNMKEAVDTAYSKIQEGAKIFIQVDSDTDGWTSSAMLIQYLKRRFNVEPVYRLHPGKEHGIVPSEIPADAQLIFIPDAGSNDFDQQKELIDDGKTVIILDHHEVNKERYFNTGSLLVNNQFSNEFKNKSLSGVGIVYMFIKAMDEIYFANDTIYTDYLDLAAVGIVADGMYVNTLGNNFIITKGLCQIKNKFIQAIAERQSQGGHGIANPKLPTKTDISFYIAPIINGVIRSGSTEDKEIGFKAMCTENSDEIFESEYRSNKRSETLYEYAARLCANAKSRQDDDKKRSLKMIEDKIEKEGLDKDNLIIVALSEEESLKIKPTITGLVAIDLVKKYNKPCLVLRKTIFNDKECFGGSGRNGEFVFLKSLLSFLKESGLVEYAEGHANAFGVFINPDKIQALRDYGNLHIEIPKEEVIFVDALYTDNIKADTLLLMDVANSNGLWGKGIECPKFGFRHQITKNDITVMGPNKTSLKFIKNGVTFVAWKCADLINQIQINGTSTIDIVGVPSVNEWMGIRTLQVIINNYELKKTESTNINFNSLL